ncbi:M6 family metalloprotease domain-containing protein [Lentibacillus halodurans]|uniref:M6 family metalloprotease domain-containing protein n=1 Tax=Lentibacillus halodurans TaxID=237679 RepID=A0A1I0Y4P5_9BACI|nr:M6 family metalloprotease domain-containing protein [Lentibacillus halodurans]SFB07716.1 M6 family metalloprotease domain-containing protein [Lentibacillus halodurans]
MRFVKFSFTILIAFLLTFMSATSVFAAQPGLPSFPEPEDTQSWVLPEDMTWDDYKSVPGIDWRNTDVEPDRVLKGALVVVDFPDREFILSQEEGSELAGNPINGNIPREDVPEFWENFLTEPQPLNNYRSIDEFWRENSYGKWAVEIDAFGTYQMDHNEFEYGMGEFGQEENLPPGYDDTYDLREDALEKAQDDIDASGETYDFTFVLHAGYDESGIWQEFGEMMFAGPEDVSDTFGPPSEFDTMQNWANTRYVDWTSWVAAKSLWSRAGNGISIQGENDGMGTFAHEFGHIMSLGDNYNNPYGDPVSRTYSGPWELMSRGSFNGPGGPHTRWMVMPTLGGSAPAHHMLRNKMKQGFLEEDDYLNLDRDELAETGPVVADITAREVPIGEEFGRDGLHGINIEMEDLTPPNSLEDDWRADMQRGEKWYDNYTIEVVDRVGFDSFQPDSGVLMAKTKNTDAPPYIWAIDAHPEDIDQVDFTRPDGSEAMYSKGDYRQLSDALFKAGTAEGVVNEYQDEHNRLHFYVLDKNHDNQGVLSYRVAVRHMDAANSFESGVDASVGDVDRAVPGRVATYNFTVTNTGEETDLFRLNVDTEAGWETMIENNVIEADAGETVTVPVYVMIPSGGRGNQKPTPTELTFQASSETDTNASTTVTRRVGPGGVR